jgi:hypothetical protein
VGADQAIDSVHRAAIGFHGPLSCAGLVDLQIGQHGCHVGGFVQQQRVLGATVAMLVIAPIAWVPRSHLLQCERETYRTYQEQGGLPSRNFDQLLE